MFPVSLLGDPALAPSRMLTGHSLLHLLSVHGWTLTARYDVEDASSGVIDRTSLVLGPTMVGDVLRHVSETFSPAASVRQFVLVLMPALAAASPAPTLEDTGPLLSILMRTQGTRNAVLIEALYSIFAQTCDEYEVLICFHNPGDTIGFRRAGVEQVVTELPEPLRVRVRLIECRDAGRGAPLNAMLEQATGRYASILDDDDLLFDHHVETIRQGVEQHGATVLFQTFASQRLLDPVASPEASPEADPSITGYPYTVVGMAVPWATPVDPIRQHFENMVPICSLAVPLALIRQTRLRFRTDLELGEEWAFWMEAMQFLRVVVLPEVTAAINHWNNPDSNAMLRPDLAPVWGTLRDARHVAAADVPLLLDGQVRLGLVAAGHQSEEIAWLRQQLADRDARLKAISRSRAWRLTRALWWLRDRLRRGR